MIVIKIPGVFGAAGCGGECSRLLLIALDGKQWSDECPGFESRQAVFDHWQFANDSGKTIMMICGLFIHDKRCMYIPQLTF